MSLRIWCISDTHSSHRKLQVPDGVDGVFIAGDVTNSRFFNENKQELDDFLDWLNTLPIKHKVMIAGNHDTWIANTPKEDTAKYILEKSGAIYLQDSGVVINDKLIYGSPWVPPFGSWSFMIDDNKRYVKWAMIPKETHVLITHGPPKGILDLSFNAENNLEFCGDKNLYNRVEAIGTIKYHMFGHIHNSKGCLNQGTRQSSKLPNTTFCNLSVMTDGPLFRQGPTSHGIAITL